MKDSLKPTQQMRMCSLRNGPESTLMKPNIIEGVDYVTERWHENPDGTGEWKDEIAKPWHGSNKINTDNVEA